MTLSLYSLHVVMRTERVWPAEEPSSFGRGTSSCCSRSGALFVAVRRRGPLEAAVERGSAPLRHSMAGQVSITIGTPPPPSGRTPPRR